MPLAPAKRAALLAFGAQSLVTVVDEDGNKRDPLKPVMFKKLADLSPYWMQIDYSKVNNNISWQVVPEQDPPFTPDEGEGDLWY